MDAFHVHQRNVDEFLADSTRTLIEHASARLAREIDESGAA